MPSGPERYLSPVPDEEISSLRLPLDPARAELIRAAQGEGMSESELVALFGEADLEAYMSNPYNIDDFGGNDAA